MNTFFFFIISTILIQSATSNIDVPSGEGIDEINADVVIRTLSPIINVAPLAGRGPAPSQSPTLKPTDNPTIEGFGSDLKFDLPGIVDPSSTSNIVNNDETKPPTYYPTVTAPPTTAAPVEPAPVIAGISAPVNVAGATVVRIWSNILVGLIAGCVAWLGFQ